MRQILYLGLRRVLGYPRSVIVPAGFSIRRGFRLLPPAAAANAANSCLKRHRFSFLNVEEHYGREMDWTAEARSVLWRYNLHYFDYLRQTNLKRSDGEKLLDSWIRGNPEFEGVGWDPYPVSQRIVNWLFFLATNYTEAKFEKHYVESLALQTAWLQRNIEYHIGANHLFANVKALLFAAGSIAGPWGEELADTGRRLFSCELDEQFLEDGGHYERSSMYHSILTQDLIDLCNLYSSNAEIFGREEMDAVTHTATAALNYLHKIDPPDHSVPFFNDAANAIAPTFGQLAEYANRIFGYSIPDRPFGLTLESLDNSGYYIIRDGNNFMMIDCGEIGPDYQPGHAHCDALSYEYFLEGRKLITNCGNFDYELSEERRYARSTAAHNTVVIDGEEQSEIWGAFRVARRARPVSAGLTRVDEGCVEFTGAHDGYKRLRHGVVHHRDIDYESGGAFLVRDTVSGRGAHFAESYIHFVAGLEVARAGNSFRVTDTDGHIVLKIRPFDTDTTDILATERYPEFGLKQTAASLRLRRQTVAPFTFGYEVAP